MVLTGERLQGQVHVLIAYSRQLDKLIFLDTVQGHLEVSTTFQHLRSRAVCACCQLGQAGRCTWQTCHGEQSTSEWSQQPHVTHMVHMQDALQAGWLLQVWQQSHVSSDSISWQQHVNARAVSPLQSISRKVSESRECARPHHPNE